MPKLAVAVKRILVGRPQRSDRLAHSLLPKRIALPVFASDAMSSVAYAPEEIFLTLSVAGVASYALSPWIGLAVVVVLLTVVTSYRQNVHAYPSGGGDYEVATVNLGRHAGLTVASALLVDYTLTVAVSISAAAANVGALVPFVAEHKVLFAVGAITILTAVNLRGIRESGAAFAVPVYAFMFAIGTMVIWGLTRVLILGDPVRAESADLQLLGRGRRVHRHGARAAGAALVHPGRGRADRGRGDQQRRAGVPQAEVEERGDDAAAARAASR